MEVSFSKYQATGNDFIMVNEFMSSYNLNETQIALMCNRHFGIGADGLILLQKDPNYNFKMVYYNSDGNQSTMCGNGGRCIVRFAKDLGKIESNAKFTAIDGLHTAKILNNTVQLGMISVLKTEIRARDTTDFVKDSKAEYFLDTGSPHHIVYVNNVDDVDVQSLGSRIRTEIYGEVGSNVNFVEVKNASTIRIRTYERGVENETLSCGTGVTAAAIATNFSGEIKKSEIQVETLGGSLTVFFKESNQQYSDIFLVGNAKRVFDGKISL